MQLSHEGGKPDLLRPFNTKDITKIAILQDLKALLDALHKGKAPVVPFHGITSLYSYIEEI